MHEAVCWCPTTTTTTTTTTITTTTLQLPPPPLHPLPSQQHQHYSNTHLHQHFPGTYYGGEEDGMGTVPEATMKRMEEGYRELQATPSKSLLKKYLTPMVFDQLKRRVTAAGATLMDVIQSGLANPDSGVGVYAADAESYIMFHDLFDPVIDDYHGGFGSRDLHPGINLGSPAALGDLNELGDYVVSTRVRCARSLEAYPFNPLLTHQQYLELEQDVERAP
ncbi:hypothetical protein Pcinc_034729 [Petrolisthes cinctipes]|uniref:arginine kinase n=1 Tax=Petrolisthes cinctipes TaxID=88211 RepID=A0AAE1C119_PETCI|nr:hypothetical protein Pcinc_034729 [Petrolisthes cinctipes]